MPCSLPCALPISSDAWRPGHIVTNNPLTLTLPCRRPPLVYELSNLFLTASHQLTAGLRNKGKALRIAATKNGKPAPITFDLRVSRGSSPAALKDADVYRGVYTDGKVPIVPKVLPKIPPPPVIHRRRRA